MWVLHTMTCSKATPANTCGGLHLSEHRQTSRSLIHTRTAKPELQCGPKPRATRPMAAGAANAWRSGWRGTVRGDMGLGCKRNACLIGISQS
jgi:hypothetical protein